MQNNTEGQPLSKIYKFDVNRKDLNYVEPERTKERLIEIAELGMEEIGVASFGLAGKMSGLYIEKVWNYDKDDWNSYMDWVRTFVN